MAPCGGNIVTPRMIKKAEIHIGDRIQIEESSAPAPEAAVAVSPAETVSAAVSSATAAEIPAASVAASENAVGLQGTFTDESGVTRRQTLAPQMQQHPEFPLNFNGMTDYVNSMTAAGGQSPSFNVPSHPMVPPEYEQTIDYDSIQYMNGFLRTQIGRYVRVEQLIGSGNTEERFGFLVGVGNNYLLLQDISDGNILVVDFYSIKFVYIYFGEPVFPNIPLGPTV